jgi:TfoX/Sxy family transcriptional regulator of competence genes
VAYDTQLAARVRKMFADDPAVREQAMFGGLAFLVADRVAVAASAGGGLLVRVETARAEQLLKTTRRTAVLRQRGSDRVLIVEGVVIRSFGATVAVRQTACR